MVQVNKNNKKSTEEEISIDNTAHEVDNDIVADVTGFKKWWEGE